MNDPKGHVCPECGTPRGADNTPSCACAERAADAHIENRTAEAAAAEDFDPLRIRPYVELTPETPGPSPTSPSSPTSPPFPEHLATDPAAEVTMPMPTVREPGRPDEAATAAIPAVPQPPDPAPAFSTEDEPPSGSLRRPRVLLLGAAGAVVVILAAGGLAGGMFTYDKPDRNNTAAQEVRESVPAATTPSSASTAPSASPTPSKSPSPTPTPSRSASPTPSPTRTAPSPTASRSATPTQAPTTAQATGTVTPAPGGDDDKETAPVLRLGDHGDEVLELQLRLNQLGLYLNDMDGVYDDNVVNAVTTYQTTRGINAEEPGVYDRTTRERLESETTEPQSAQAQQDADLAVTATGDSAPQP
ncbi:peptidoglycan-binding domain-containing protein [Streptomyces sp. NBC_00576]|uniref:peptidoglycan-binding domain-containing protein n=1 Tax=Streptomyces sp. NBC_00576 TaxID=2903665 RepID=UPI002E80639C|nr:peptidoglycan-binding domain-containing protein [Streptomyces sp. NBC_00576]WUB74826.1 peptidoglycan-binding protein [Streptomyces sp. NBC_00576]